METPQNKFLYDPGLSKVSKYSVRHERAMDCRLHLVNLPKLVRAHIRLMIVFSSVRVSHECIRQEQAPWQPRLELAIGAAISRAASLLIHRCRRAAPSDYSMSGSEGSVVRPSFRRLRPSASLQGTPSLFAFRPTLQGGALHFIRDSFQRLQ
jgi:hypothetical protein